MEDEPDFTMGDLLRDLAEEFGIPQTYQERCGSHGAYTSTEIARRLGVSRYAVMKKIKKGHEQGRIEIVRKKVVRFGSDIETTVPAYRKIQKEKESVTD